MARTLTCSHGHQRQVPADGTMPADKDLRCPVCQGLDADPPPSDRPAAVRTVRALLAPSRESGGGTKPRPNGTPRDGSDGLADGGPDVPGYEILGALGRGGMGVVYQARQPALGRMVDRLDDRRPADVPRLQELREGQLEDALVFYQTLLEDGSPLEPAVQLDVATAFQQAGLTELRLTRGRQARQSIRQAAALLEGLTARGPDRPEYQAQLAVCYSGLAFCDEATDPPNHSEHWLRWTPVRCRPADPCPAAPLFERLYKGRTAVERVNARLKIFWGADDGNVTGARRFHAFVGAVLVVHLTLAPLLAQAPRWEGTLGQTRLGPGAEALCQPPATSAAG